MDNAELHDVENQTSLPRLKSIGVALGVIVLAIVFADLLSFYPHSQIDSASGSVENFWFATATALSFVGMALGGFVYLHITDRGIAYIDLQKPTLKTVKYTVIGVIGTIGALIAFNAIILLFDLPVAESSITNEIQSDIQLAWLFLGIVFLFNAPAEEFLFRNVVQKRLGEVFSLTNAVLITSALFALMHIPGYLLVASMVESVVPLVLIFVASLIFGVLYAKTEDLGVVIAVHAIYNALQILPFIVVSM